MEVDGLLKKKSKKSKAEKKAKKIKKSKKEKRSPSTSSVEKVEVDVQEKAETFTIPNMDTAKSDPIPAAPSKPWNDWDSAKFADDSRKNKFLRLLGAKKNQSSLVPGEQKVVDQVKFDREMEKQFEVGRQMQFGSAGKRSGLGAQ